MLRFEVFEKASVLHAALPDDPPGAARVSHTAFAARCAARRPPGSCTGVAYCICCTLRWQTTPRELHGCRIMHLLHGCSLACFHRFLCSSTAKCYAHSCILYLTYVDAQVLRGCLSSLQPPPLPGELLLLLLLFGRLWNGQIFLHAHPPVPLFSHRLHPNLHHVLQRCRMQCVLCRCLRARSVRRCWRVFASFFRARTA